MNKSGGMSLIEVLISLVILSVGVLAVVALQFISKRNNMDAGERTIAAQMAYDILERMRINSSTAALGAYVGNASPYPAAYIGRGTQEDGPLATCKADDNNTSPVTCDTTTLARHDLWEWELALDGSGEKIDPAKNCFENPGNCIGGLTLPTACIEGPAGGGSGVYTVIIAWRGKIEIRDRNTDGDADNDIACGSAATDAGGKRLYGDADEFRRIVTVTAYITARVITAI